MPIIRYTWEVGTSIRSFGKKVEVVPKQAVEVTVPELESIRKGPYKKYFESDANFLATEIVPKDGENVASGRTEPKETAPDMPTKRKMLAELEALGIEITAEIKKYNSEQLFNCLSIARSTEDDEKDAEQDENAHTDENDGTDDAKDEERTEA